MPFQFRPGQKTPAASRPRGSYIGRLWACEGDREVLVLANVMVGVFLVFVGLALLHHLNLWPDLSDTGKIAGLVALVTAVLAIPQLVLFHRHCAHCQHPG